MRRGSSGATITYDTDFVTKRDPNNNPRVVWQGQWLLDNPSPAVPSVYTVYATAYKMERLAVVPPALLNHAAVLDTMVERLATHVWSQSAVAPINHDMLFDKVERLVNTYGFEYIWQRLYMMRARVNWHRLTRCLTHGDPTFDNVMIREFTGELVLADPIPATLIVPDLLSVDVGKILQSALGWEAARYEDEGQKFNVNPVSVYDVVQRHMPKFAGEDEWVASIFWCVVHLLRTLPYVDDSVRLRVRGLVNGALSLL
jgi:hypothetical protein